MLSCTARNLNAQLFRVSASFDNKIKTKGLILPSCEDQIPLSKEFTDTPTGSLCMILIPASCLQIVSGLSLSKVSKRFISAFYVVRTIQRTDT